MKYSSTLLKYFLNCPKSLDNYLQGVPRDTDVYQAGIAAHAVLQVVGEKKAKDADAVKTVADTVVKELITTGRSFAGKPEPPMNPEHAFIGRDIALAYLETTDLPENGQYEVGLGMTRSGDSCAYNHPDCRYRAVIDVLYPDVAGDEDFSADVITVRDYKTAWPTNADELDTLQRKGQAVLAWLAYRGDDAVKGIQMEVVNLRTHQSFRRVIWLDEQGEDTLRKWQADILSVCDAADTARQARPGGGCLVCPWVLSCEDSYRAAMNVGADALALTALEARRKELVKILKRELEEQEPLQVNGGYVGYRQVTKMQPTDDAVYHIIVDFYNRALRPVTYERVPMEHPLEVGLLTAAKLGSGNIQAIAKHLYDRSEMDARKDFLRRALKETTAVQFGVWREKE